MDRGAWWATKSRTRLSNWAQEETNELVFFFFSLSLHHKKVQQGSGHLQAPKQVLTRTYHASTLTLSFQPPEQGEITVAWTTQSLLFFLHQPVLTKTNRLRQSLRQVVQKSSGGSKRPQKLLEGRVRGASCWKHGLTHGGNQREFGLSIRGTCYTRARGGGREGVEEKVGSPVLLPVGHPCHPRTLRVARIPLYSLPLWSRLNSNPLTDVWVQREMGSHSFIPFFVTQTILQTVAWRKMKTTVKFHATLWSVCSGRFSVFLRPAASQWDPHLPVGLYGAKYRLAPVLRVQTLSLWAFDHICACAEDVSVLNELRCYLPTLRKPPPSSLPGTCKFLVFFWKISHWFG